MREEKQYAIEVHVGGICVKDGKILVAKRSDKRHLYPSKWECGGGQVLPGENFEEAIIRQHREELSIDSIVLKPLHVYEIIVESLPQKKIPGVSFLCTTSSTPIIDEKEFVEWRWVSKEEVAEMDFIPSLKKQILSKSEEIFSH